MRCERIKEALDEIFAWYDIATRKETDALDSHHTALVHALRAQCDHEMLSKQVDQEVYTGWVTELRRECKWRGLAMIPGIP